MTDTPAPAETGRVIHVSEGGIAGEPPARPDVRIPAAPAVDAKFNTIRAPLRPVACWRVEEARFAFDSSFVLPEMDAEMALLAELRDAHALADPVKREVFFPALTVFGHADPTGNDDYNKALSGRRAQAVYALLTRRTDLWEALFSTRGWGPESLAVMQTAVGPSPGLGTPAGRQALYLKYMDHVCVRRDGQPYRVAAGEFLGGGADAGGKADFQGCGEFNPVLLFSREEKLRLDRPENHEVRDIENEPNRRVTIFLFRPGLRFTASRWPCPRAREDTSGCRRRFFSDAETRRSFQSERRLQQVTRDTFACRFYDRIAGDSPCDVALPVFKVRLYDSRGVFIRRAPYRLSLEGRPPIETLASPSGFAVVRGIPKPTRGMIEWGLPPAAGAAPGFEFVNEVFFDPRPEAQAEAERKLAHLGHTSPRLRDNVTAFQREQGLTVTGELDAQTQAVLRDVHDHVPDRLHAGDSA